MRRFLWVALLFSLAAGLLAQSSQTEPDHGSNSPPAPCIVAGRVVTAAEGAPVKSAHVTLWQQNLGKSNPDIYHASTDNEGHFLLKDVAPGRYEFVVSHAGFVTRHYQANGDDQGAVLALTPGEKVTDVLFRMRLAAVITGRVNDPEGEPMVGVRVTALRRRTEEEIEEQDVFPKQKLELIASGSAFTDDRGQYRIFGLKPGEYYLREAESDNPTGVNDDFWAGRRIGSEYVAVYFPGVLRVDQAQAVSVSVGGGTGGLLRASGQDGYGRGTRPRPPRTGNEGVGSAA